MSDTPYKPEPGDLVEYTREGDGSVARALVVRIEPNGRVYVAVRKTEVYFEPSEIGRLRLVERFQ